MITRVLVRISKRYDNIETQNTKLQREKEVYQHCITV
jgi:hypothetical protein